MSSTWPIRASWRGPDLQEPDGSPRRHRHRRRHHRVGPVDGPLAAGRTADAPAGGMFPSVRPTASWSAAPITRNGWRKRASRRRSSRMESSRPSSASPAPTACARQYGLEGVLTVGLVGSVVWSPRHRSVLRLGPDRADPHSERPIPSRASSSATAPACRSFRRGARSTASPIESCSWARCLTRSCPHRLGLIDVCLSTQTNDLVGQVRTTGKLPLYLAAGRYILASRVGEAARILDEEMLVDYEGNNDLQYPEKLAERVLRLWRIRRCLTGGSARRPGPGRNSTTPCWPGKWRR